MTAIQSVETKIKKVDSQPVMNDFSITVGTINGSGSQTSNLTLLRALFKMGVPVSGKNLFPSNIQGEPTWYTIRINKHGYMARQEEHEIVVAMNPNSFLTDLEQVIEGGVFLYADDIKQSINREDILAYPMPVKRLARESGAPSDLRNYVANMVYVGVLAQFLNIELDKIYQSLDFHFKGKTEPIDMNFGVIQSAYQWSLKNIDKVDQYFIEPMNETDGFIMTDGNTAAALGAIYGGVQFASWYPITPATSLAEALKEYLQLLREDPVEDGKNTYAVIQAEDELAAIGMAIGAGWSGLRAMTATSGPGLSLMAEYSGLAYFAEIPVVIWVIQRVGPSTGLPTRTAQGDLIFTHFLGHGDTQQVILLPGSVNDCFEFGWKAFDIAEQLQTPVFVLSDLDFGMNQWMAKPFEYPDEKINRGKILWDDDLDKLNGDWARYRDIDEDGIPYRTLPGNRHPASAYFTRGTGHSDDARYTEDSAEWEKLMSRLKRKFQRAADFVPAPIVDEIENAVCGLIAFGSTKSAIDEARNRLLKAGIPTDFIQIRALPFSDEVCQFIARHPRNYVIEVNRDGQLYMLLKMEFPEHSTTLTSITHLDGLSLTARFVFDAISAEEQ